MKQDRKIWGLILGIVLIGMGITFLTQSYVSSRQEARRMTAPAGYADSVAAGESMAEEQPDSEKAEAGVPSPLSAGGVAVAEAEVQPKEAGGYGAISEGPSQAPDVGKSQPALGEEKKAASPDTASRLSGGSGQSPPFVGEEAGMGDSGAAPGALYSVSQDSTVETEEMAEAQEKIAVKAAIESETDFHTKLKECETRLAELDVQIERMRSQETENTIQSVKSAARTEQGIWERELDSVYVLLVTSLDEAQGEALRVSQQQWIELRDAAALEASRKGEGGSLESVEYIASIAASTRLRVYELVKQYQE